jgi:hypothetical protein
MRRRIAAVRQLASNAASTAMPRLPGWRHFLGLASTVVDLACSSLRWAYGCSRTAGGPTGLIFATPMLLVAMECHAAPPIGQSPDPRLEAWFRRLQQPGTGRSCCSISDCRVVEHDVLDGEYRVKIDDEWHRIPPNIVIRDAGNPLGRAIACYISVIYGPGSEPHTPLQLPPMPATIDVLCFVPPIGV